MNLQDLTTRINAVADHPPLTEAITAEDRLALLGALKKLENAIEAPMDATSRIVLGVCFLKTLLE